MRGVSFEIPNAYGKQLFDIFNGIDITSGLGVLVGANRISLEMVRLVKIYST